MGEKTSEGLMGFEFLHIIQLGCVKCDIGLKPCDLEDWINMGYNKLDFPITGRHFFCPQCKYIIHIEHKSIRTT